MVDLILFCDLEITKDDDGNPTYRRVMRTKPSPNYEAGDRTGRLPETIDLDFSKFIEVFNVPATAPKASASRSQVGSGDKQSNVPVSAGK